MAQREERSTFKLVERSRVGRIEIGQGAVDGIAVVGRLQEGMETRYSW